jgi:hypothetical protein
MQADLPYRRCLNRYSHWHSDCSWNRWRLSQCSCPAWSASFRITWAGRCCNNGLAHSPRGWWCSRCSCLWGDLEHIRPIEASAIPAIGPCPDIRNYIRRCRSGLKLHNVSSGLASAHRDQSRIPRDYEVHVDWRHLCSCAYCTPQLLVEESQARPNGATSRRKSHW